MPSDQSDMFWQVLEELDQKERVQFLRFASGWERLTPSALLTKNMVLTALTNSARGMCCRPLSPMYRRDALTHYSCVLDSLPTSSTCFFEVKLPPYSSKEKMLQLLRTAITECVSIDTDFLVRA